jgi:hypothetical protein
LCTAITPHSSLNLSLRSKPLKVRLLAECLQLLLPAALLSLASLQTA